MNKRSLLPIILVGLVALSACKKREEPVLSITNPPKSSKDSADAAHDTSVNQVDHVTNIDPIDSVDPQAAKESEIIVRINELNEKLDEAGLEGTRRAVAIVGLQHDLKFEEFLAPYFEEYQKFSDEIAALNLSDSEKSEFENLKLRIDTIKSIVPAFMAEIKTYESHKDFLKKVGIEIVQDDNGNFKVQDRFVFIESAELKLARFNQYIIPTDERINYNKLLGEYRTSIMIMGGLTHQARSILEMLPTPEDTILESSFGKIDTYMFRKPRLEDFRYRNLKVEDDDYAVDQLGEVQHILRSFISKFKQPMSEARLEKELKLLQFVVDLTLNAMIIEKELKIIETTREGLFNDLFPDFDPEKSIIEIRNTENFSQIAGRVDHEPRYIKPLVEASRIRRLSEKVIQEFKELNPPITMMKGNYIFIRRK